MTAVLCKKRFLKFFFIPFKLTRNLPQSSTYMPLMTPSGLSMGMILKTKVSLRLWATKSLLHKNSRVPFIIQLALDSPGWTRPDNTMQGRLPGEK